MPPFAPFPLTPSELIYLNGELYAKKVFINNVKLIHAEVSVSAADLAYTMLAAAFLASEAEGVLRLVIGKRKTLLGSKDALFAEPISTINTWPQPSLESKLLANSQALLPKNKHTISGIVYQILDADYVSPGYEIVELCKPYLASRRLVEQTEKKALGIFKTYSYSLPMSTLQGARQFPMERINQLLTSTPQSRPEVWKQLMAGIKSGISQRIEQSSSDD